MSPPKDYTPISNGKNGGRIRKVRKMKNKKAIIGIRATLAIIFVIIFIIMSIIILLNNNLDETNQQTIMENISANCDPSYPDVCIPDPPPVLNCSNISSVKNFRVLFPDPHGFDDDYDGIGCESQT